MNLQLNYHHLRYFLAVAVEGSIKGASAALHISPPTLSAQIRALEDSLGTPLFKREGRRLTANDAGFVVRRYAEKIFSLGDEMVEVVQRGAPVGPQIVHVGIGDAVPKYLVSSMFARARHDTPDLRIVVREGLPEELYPSLAAHQVDLVVANEPPPVSLKAALFCRPAGRFAVSFVAVPSLVKKFHSQRGLNGFPVVVPTRESPLRRELERGWTDEGVRPEIVAECDDVAAMCEMAADGAGATPLIAPVLSSAAQRFGLRPLSLRTGIYEELFVVTAERQFTHEGVRSLVRIAVATADLCVDKTRTFKSVARR